MLKALRSIHPKKAKNRMKTVKKAIKQSTEVIREHKHIFLVLFATQLLFLIISSFVFVNFSMSVGENLKGLLEPIEAIANVPEEQLISSLGPIVEKYGTYQEMLKSLTLFITAMYVIYIIVNGINWDLSNLMVNKKSPFLKYEIKFAILVFVFTLPIIAIINITSQYVFNIEQLQIAIPFYALLSFILLYFMYISFASINKVMSITHYPTIIKDAFLTGVKKAHILLPTFLITTGLPALFLYMISTQLEENFGILLLLIAIFIVLINWGRIVLLLVVKQLEKIK